MHQITIVRVKTVLSRNVFGASTIPWCRHYAVQAHGTPTLEIFDGRVKRLQKDRAASNKFQSRQVDYVRDEVAARLCDRVLDINREFPSVLDFGANACNIARVLSKSNNAHELAMDRDRLSQRIGHLFCIESSKQLLFRDVDEPFNSGIKITRQILQNEEYLPCKPESFDMVLSCSSLHWVNNLPSVLAQIHSCLKPDAPFIATMSGGDTLFELRGSLQLAEQDRLGGIGVHVSPFADVRDIGNLLGRAGFKLLTIDVDDIVVNYPDVFALMKDLQAMGEGNAAIRREYGPINRDALLATNAIYRELYGDEQEDGTVTIPATFRTIYMIGWKEGTNTPQPIPRGSGQISLADALGSS